LAARSLSPGRTEKKKKNKLKKTAVEHYYYILLKWAVTRVERIDGRSGESFHWETTGRSAGYSFIH
jgi:hypothetical protein